MMEVEIRKKVKDFISDTFLLDNEKDTLNDSDSFMNNGIIDSTGVLEFTSFIESESLFQRIFIRS